MAAFCSQKARLSHICLWVALWGSGTVGKFNPLTGELLQKVIVPAPNVSSCAFGGKNLETLYITTARAWVNEAKLKEFPLSGGLFSVKSGVHWLLKDEMHRCLMTLPGMVVIIQLIIKEKNWETQVRVPGM